MTEPSPHRPGREPAFNAPTVVVALLALFAAIHVARQFISDETDTQVLLLFAFFPIRYDSAALQGAVVPGGVAADIWTFVSYALLHGSWLHLIFNGVWMLAFGTAVAWRFGAVRFLLFSAVCAAAGAGLHLAFHWGEPVPVIGASAAIGGQMAAAIRFMFQPGAPLGLFRIDGATAFRVPALPLRDILRDQRALIFIGLWFALNIVSGLGALFVGADGDSIAWQAHIGGFVAGLLLFPLFDGAARRGL